MIGTRSALLATSLLLAVPVMAAQPEGGRYVYVPPGATIVLLPVAAPTVPVDFPVARLVAQQQAMMQRMMADMDALMATPMPDPEQMIRSVMDGMPQAAPGTGVVLTQISNGAGTCSETIVYGPQGANGRQQVKVTRTGNACGAITSNRPIGVTQTTPAAPQTVPPATATPPQDRLWHVSYPARPVTIHTASPRT
jgi:hypothetical protein